MKKIMFALMSVFVCACGSGQTIGTGPDEERPQTVIEVVEGDSGTADAGQDAAGDDSTGPDGSVQDSGTGSPTDAGTGGAADSGAADTGPVSQQDSRLNGTWLSGNGGELFVFSPVTNGYFFQNLQFPNAGTGLAEEDDGNVLIENQDLLTFTTNASSCEQFEKQPLPYQLIYSIDTAGTSLTLTNPTTHYSSTYTLDTSDPMWGTGCQEGHFVLAPVTNF